MRKRPELRPGRTYILDDFTIAQVVEITGVLVSFRMRGWSWTLRRRVVIRRTRLVQLARRVRAEVDGALFPDISLPDLHRFERPSAETAGLDAYLAAQTARRPFAGGG